MILTLYDKHIEEGFPLTAPPPWRKMFEMHIHCYISSKWFSMWSIKWLNRLLTVFSLRRSVEVCEVRARSRSKWSSVATGLIYIPATRGFGAWLDEKCPTFCHFFHDDSVVASTDSLLKSGHPFRYFNTANLLFFYTIWMYFSYSILFQATLNTHSLFLLPVKYAHTTRAHNCFRLFIFSNESSIFLCTHSCKQGLSLSKNKCVIFIFTIRNLICIGQARGFIFYMIVPKQLHTAWVGSLFGRWIEFLCKIMFC